ncbi:Imm1 family immunity protein [Saccharopolyspora cebuensis]|uniref:Imm1 family immunity protein n=1 Tax=Saccharopolyspora cebuensis TaxID=418759 RepID=A0ABV4CGR4_9PSEU
MTLSIELEDMTSLDATDVRSALASQQADERVVVHLVHDNGSELIVGFRGDRGVCLWQLDDGLVTTGGRNEGVEIYGWSEIPFPPGAEVDAAAVLDAAEEFAATGERPTCLSWTGYHDAMPLVDPAITPEALQALLDEPDSGR